MQVFGPEEQGSLAAYQIRASYILVILHQVMQVFGPEGEESLQVFGPEGEESLQVFGPKGEDSLVTGQVGASYILAILHQALA